MALTALEATTNFITSRNIREGETFSLASLQVRYPNKDELLAVLETMQGDGLIENTPEGPYRLTGAGYLKFFGHPPTADDTIKAIMSEIATRGVKAGKTFLWLPMQEHLELKRFRPGELKPALEQIFNNHWLEQAQLPGFFKLTEAGFAALGELP